MILTILSLALPSICNAFHINTVSPRTAYLTSLRMGVDKDTRAAMDMSGNAWKPTEGRMQATDVGDFFPDGYVDELDFTDGIKGVSGLTHPKVNPPQQKQSRGNQEPALPGMEFMDDSYLEEDVIKHNLADGIQECNPYTEQCIPEGMEFIPSSVADGEIEIPVSITSAGEHYILKVEPYCMGFEDFFAGFTPDSHPAFYVQPSSGRMDKRGGKATYLQVTCDPRGQDFKEVQEFTATLVINVPEDDSKLTYNIRAPLVAGNRGGNVARAGYWDEVNEDPSKRKKSIDYDINVDAYSRGAMGGIVPGMRLTSLCEDD